MQRSVQGQGSVRLAHELHDGVCGNRVVVPQRQSLAFTNPEPGGLLVQQLGNRGVLLDRNLSQPGVRISGNPQLLELSPGEFEDAVGGVQDHRIAVGDLAPSRELQRGGADGDFASGEGERVPFYDLKGAVLKIDQP